MKRQIIRHLERMTPGLITRARASREYFCGEPEIRLLRLFVPPDKTAIDIGANNGVYTVWLRRYARNVIAVEPNPSCCTLLRRAFDDRVSVVNAACSDHHGSAQLRIPTPGGTANLYRGSIDAGVSFDTNTIGITVETVPLDVLAKGPVGFIKIDVEGHELAVLAGAGNVLKRDRPTVLVEAEERHKRGTVASVMAHFAELRYAGYFLFGKQILPFDDFNPKLHQRGTEAGPGARSNSYVNNFIFIPRENHVSRDNLLLRKNSQKPIP